MKSSGFDKSEHFEFVYTFSRLKLTDYPLENMSSAPRVWLKQTNLAEPNTDRRIKVLHFEYIPQSKIIGYLLIIFNLTETGIRWESCHIFHLL